MPFGGASQLADLCSMPLELSLGTKTLSFALSQLHTFPVAQLLLTPWITCLRCAQTNIHTFACFVLPSIMHHNLHGPHIPPLIFTSYHERGSNLLPPDFDHTTNPTSYTVLAIFSKYVLLRAQCYDVLWSDLVEIIITYFMLATSVPPGITCSISSDWLILTFKTI